jgi:hypothetical protein
MDNDSLFALRTYYQDYYEDENDIIQMLKTNIMEQDQVNDEIANNKLYEFYNFYGINIQKDVFKEIKCLPPLINTDENSINDILSLFLNSNIDENNDNENNENENGENENNENENGENENNENNEDNEDNENATTENRNINYRLINLSNTVSNLSNISVFLTNIANNINRTDVVCTLDENDKNNLKKYNLEETLEMNCNICLELLEKNQEILELPCEHKYHFNCIDVYLDKYNYKCPCCRKEIGKPKYNI